MSNMSDAVNPGTERRLFFLGGRRMIRMASQMLKPVTDDRARRLPARRNRAGCFSSSNVSASGSANVVSEQYLDGDSLLLPRAVLPVPLSRDVFSPSVLSIRPLALLLRTA